MTDDERELHDAACACAELLVRLVRPMYAGPTGDQGLNDPLYGECQRAIKQYRTIKYIQRARELIRPQP